MISVTEKIVDELPHELPNDLRLRILQKKTNVYHKLERKDCISRTRPRANLNPIVT